MIVINTTINTRIGRPNVKLVRLGVSGIGIYYRFKESLQDVCE